MPGLLVGQHGKERCSRANLTDFLNGRTSPVTRLVLNLLPNHGLVIQPRLQSRSGWEVRVFPHRVVSGEKLKQAVHEMQTREGADIHPLGVAEQPTSATTYWYRPAGLRRSSTDGSTLTLTSGDDCHRMRLRIADEAVCAADPAGSVFDLIDFDMRGLISGRRILARRAEPGTSRMRSGRILSGRMRVLSREGEGLTFEAAGELAGTFVLRPVRLKGEECFSFHKIVGSLTGSGR
jgi:hypothetical protein